MLTRPIELERNGSIEALYADSGPSCDAPTRLALALERCDREIAASLRALLNGSVPIVEALLWYTDWCRERELIILASDKAGIGGGRLERLPSS
jgi:hypothetical protein